MTGFVDRASVGLISELTSSALRSLLLAGAAGSVLAIVPEGYFDEIIRMDVGSVCQHCPAIAGLDCAASAGPGSRISSQPSRTTCSDT